MIELTLRIVDNCVNSYRGYNYAMNQKATQTELFKLAFHEQMKDVGTSIPGHVVAFDPKTQLAQLQIGIKRTDKAGNVYDPAVLIECMIQFTGGSSFHIEHQIDPGDEGIIIFSQRCIDGWVNTGGVASNPILRFHDVNDAYFIPGIRSQPNVITGFDNNGIKLRNKTGDKFVWLKNDGSLKIKATDVDIESLTLTHNGTDVGETHKHVGNLGNLTSDPI